MGKKSVELKFLSSFGLLLVSLIGVFFLLKVLTPPESSKQLQDLKKQEVAADGLRASARQSLSSKDSPFSGSSASQSQIEKTEEDKKASKDSSSSFDQLLSDAMRLIDEAQPQAALAVLEKILEQDPNNEIALVEIAMIHLIDLKDTPAAVPFLEKAIKINPNNKVVLAELMSVYDELDQTEGGANFLQKVYDEYPESSDLAIGLGQLYIDQDKPQEAIQVLERASNEDSSNPDVWSHYGQALSENHQNDKAIDSYDRALQAQIQRHQNGYYDNQPGSGQEKIAIARLDLIGALLMDKNEAGAQKQLEQLKKDLPEEALTQIIEQFKQRGETSSSRF